MIFPKLLWIATTIMMALSPSIAFSQSTPQPSHPDVAEVYPAPWDINVASYALLLDEDIAPDAYPTTFDGFSCHNMVNVHTLDSGVTRMLDVTWCHNESSGIVTALGDVAQTSDGWAASLGRCGWGSSHSEGQITCTWFYADMSEKESQEGDQLVSETFIFQADGSVVPANGEQTGMTYDCARSLWSST